jgi:hypothetical protein
MYFDAAAYPESRLLYIEHLTRDVLWQPHLLDHPNGAVALSDVFLCTPDAEKSAGKYARLFGVEAQAARDGEWRLTLAHGRVWILGPEAWARRAPGAAPPALPCPAGVGFRVLDLQAARTLLANQGIASTNGLDGSFWVSPEHACGATLFFFDY